MSESCESDGARAVSDRVIYSIDADHDFSAAKPFQKRAFQNGAAPSVEAAIRFLRHDC